MSTFCESINFLGEKVLALKKGCQSVRREDRLDCVRTWGRQVVQIYAENDCRVYVLYGLMEEE